MANSEQVSLRRKADNFRRLASTIADPEMEEAALELADTLDAEALQVEDDQAR